MTLPSPADYVDLLQHPESCFVDPELQRGQARTDVLGLPLAYRGNYAVAFQLRTGSKAYAVRCFTREVPEVQRRYDAISRFCEAHVDPALCTFEYQASGIRQRDAVFPIVKMEWAPGERLDTWLTNNHEDRRGLRRVAEGISQIADRLERKGAAHGDLQHGNLVVESGWVRLIDYDGMFVPGLETLRSPVIGHRNYQHPGRNETQFDARIDRFSLLVIFIGINALAADPTRYARYGCDERILFERSDFERPDGSPLFHELVLDATVGKWTLALLDACRKSPRACPSLESVLNGSYLAQVGVVTLAAAPTPSATARASASASSPNSTGAAATPAKPRVRPRRASAPSWAQPPVQSAPVQPPPTAQQTAPTLPPGVSAMPSPNAPYPPGSGPSKRVPRGMWIAGSVAATLLLFWHPWIRTPATPHFPDFTFAPTARETAVPTAREPAQLPPVSGPGRRETPAKLARETPTATPETATPEAATPEAATPEAATEQAVADEKSSPASVQHARSKRTSEAHTEHHVAAAKQEAPVPAITTPARTSSAAADIEEFAQRGRVPSSTSAESGKADPRTTQIACSQPDQDAAPTNLATPDTPDSLAGRNVAAEVRVRIDPAGHVVGVAIERSAHNADADAAALAAARASSFRPARKNCQTVGGEYSVEFTFN